MVCHIDNGNSDCNHNDISVHGESRGTVLRALRKREHFLSTNMPDSPIIATAAVTHRLILWKKFGCIFVNNLDGNKVL